MMSIWRNLIGPVSVGIFTLALVGCLGTEVKTVGKKSTSTDTTGTSDLESFSITLAYRQTSSRVVALQGVRDIPSANLSIPCGSSGTTCTCLFYKTTTDTAPVGTSGIGMSTGVNSLSCTIAGATDPSLYKYVRLKNASGSSSTGFISIKSSLAIEDVLGDLDKNKVRGIYRYSCTRTFFEGEGVVGTNINPVPNQRLGLITAPYDFYLYSSQTATGEQPASILGEKSPGNVFPNGVLGLQLASATCTGSAAVRYGLYGEKGGPFQVGITMTIKPEPIKENEVIDVLMGYAALPDTAGNCPTGLIKIRPWQAQPQSIIAGSIDGTNPQSNFINNGTLNNTVVEETQPAAMAINRAKNATPCNGTSTDANNPTGWCKNATFQPSVPVQTAVYSPLSPVVCAIPSNLLSGVIP